MNPILNEGPLIRLKDYYFDCSIVSLTNMTNILKLHPDYDPRKERATLLRLSDISSPEANRNSSYSYLISLGKGESLSSILNNVVDQNNPGEKVPKVFLCSNGFRPFLLPLLCFLGSNYCRDRCSDKQRWEFNANFEESFILNAKDNLFKNSMFSGEQDNSGFTSLSANDSTLITFPSEKRDSFEDYYTDTGPVISSIRDDFDAEPRIPRPTRRPVSVTTHRRSSPGGGSAGV